MSCLASVAFSPTIFLAKVHVSLRLCTVSCVTSVLPKSQPHQRDIIWPLGSAVPCCLAWEHWFLTTSVQHL